jgi:hypothetical protein
LESQFAGFMEAEKRETARLVSQARTLRMIVTVASFAFFFLCIAVAVYLLMHRAVRR